MIVVNNNGRHHGQLILIFLQGADYWFILVNAFFNYVVIGYVNIINFLQRFRNLGILNIIKLVAHQIIVLIRTDIKIIGRFKTETGQNLFEIFYHFFIRLGILLQSLALFLLVFDIAEKIAKLVGGERCRFNRRKFLVFFSAQLFVRLNFNLFGYYLMISIINLLLKEQRVVFVGIQ